MVWERQEPVTPRQPVAPSSGRWFLSGVLVVIVGVLLFILHASGLLSLLNAVNIWLFSLAPVVLWLIIFSVRGYLYGRDLERFQFLQHEAEHAQQQWTAWAERYLTIMASGLMLPEQVSAALLQDRGRQLTQHQNLVRRIDYLDPNQPASVAAMAALLSVVEDALLTLPPELPLQVTLLTDEPPATRQNVYSLFTDCWQEKFPERPGPSSLTITEQWPFDTLDERLKQPETTVQLVLVMQLQGEGRYSDGLAVLLFTTDDVAHQYTLPHQARLLRPMSWDVNNLKQELTLFLTTQTQAQRTVNILGDRQKWTDSTSALLTTGNALGTTWSADDIQIIETYCGIQGPFSPWLTVALGTDFVRIGQQSWLGLSTTGTENFVYTITAGSGDERVK